MHTALSWSLLLPLALRYPRYGVLWLLLPASVSIGRLVLEAHCLSDVVFAMYVVGMYAWLTSLLYLAAGKEEATYLLPEIMAHSR